MGQVNTDLLVDYQHAHEINSVGKVVEDVQPIIYDEKEQLLRKLDLKIYDYISHHVIPERESVLIKNINRIDELKASDFKGKSSFVNLGKLNNARYINRFLIHVNDCMTDTNIFIGNAEMSNAHKKRIVRDRKNIFFKLFYFLCFIYHRVLPKVKYLNKIYFLLTGGNYRWLTQAEVLGRLVSCGFDIIEYNLIDDVLYFVVMKTGEPVRNQHPSYGPLFPMKRIGKDGKLIKVYKLRTMHPYSEYLQSYIVSLNGYNEVGKPADDFRVTQWGKFFRKCWLDELPQLINLFKGELALVGVRPLSRTRFNELPDDVKEMRVKFKPGCIPPYVALNMPDSEGNIEAERIYMQEKLKYGIRTDVKYAFMAIYNVLSGKIKSS